MTEPNPLTAAELTECAEYYRNFGPHSRERRLVAQARRAEAAERRVAELERENERLGRLLNAEHDLYLNALRYAAELQPAKSGATDTPCPFCFGQRRTVKMQGVLGRTVEGPCSQCKGTGRDGETAEKP